MSYPTSASAYGIWSLNEVRDAEYFDRWPGTLDAYTLQPLGDNSCVRFYPLDGSAEDLIGNDTTAIAPLNSFVTGRINQGFNTGDLSNGKNIPIEAYSGGTSGSYTFWVYVPSGTPGGTINPVLRDNNVGNNINVIARTGGFKIRQSNGNETTTTFPYDEWVHITFIRTGATTCTVYANGANPEDLSGARTDADDYIQICDDGFFIDNLVLDHLRFFNKELTSLEVQQVYLTDNSQ